MEEFKAEIERSWESGGFDEIGAEFQGCEAESSAGFVVGDADWRMSARIRNRKR